MLADYGLRLYSPSQSRAVGGGEVLGLNPWNKFYGGAKKKKNGAIILNLPWALNHN